MVDVNAIGAGGGSIAWLDAAGGLRVGPQSAGSEPGPACYGNGGHEATVTDASLVLGYLDPDYFAGGALAARSGARRGAYRRTHRDAARPLGRAGGARHPPRRQCQMAEGIRLVSIRSGYDPRRFALVRARRRRPAARASRSPTSSASSSVVVPRIPGVLSAARPARGAGRARDCDGLPRLTHEAMVGGARASALERARPPGARADGDGGSRAGERRSRATPPISAMSASRYYLEVPLTLATHDVTDEALSRLPRSA